MGGGVSSPRGTPRGEIDEDELVDLGSKTTAKPKGIHVEHVAHMYKMEFTATKTIDWSKGDYVDESEARDLLGAHFDDKLFNKLHKTHKGKANVHDIVKHAVHVLQEPHKHKQADPHEYYSSNKSINAAIASESTFLIKGEFFVELHAKGGKVPRRQDVPVDEFFTDPVGPPCKESMEGFENCIVIALSYCWLSREHPDPNGHYLKLIALLVSFLYRTKDARGGIGDKKIAVFWDWCSIPQFWGGGRTIRERALFQIGLGDVNLWYGHQYTWKFLCTYLPENPTGRPDYEHSGWTMFEKGVCELASDSWNVLDLKFLRDINLDKVGSTHELRDLCVTGSMLDGPAKPAAPAEDEEVAGENTDKTNNDEDIVVQTGRSLPQSPEAYSKILKSRAFTNGSDADFVAKKYTKMFNTIFNEVEELDFRDLNVATEDWDQFFKLVLPRCKKLKRLNVSNNVTCCASLKIFASLPGLEFLDLSNTGIEAPNDECPGDLEIDPVRFDKEDYEEFHLWIKDNIHVFDEEDVEFHDDGDDDEYHHIGCERESPRTTGNGEEKEPEEEEAAAAAEAEADADADEEPEAEAEEEAEAEAEEDAEEEVDAEAGGGGEDEDGEGNGDDDDEKEDEE